MHWKRINVTLAGVTFVVVRRESPRESGRLEGEGGGEIGELFQIENRSGIASGYVQSNRSLPAY